MIGYLLLAAAVAYGVSRALRRRRAPVVAGEPTWAVDRLQGPGWSLVALNTSGRLRAVDVDDPSVDFVREVAMVVDQDAN